MKGAQNTELCSLGGLRLKTYEIIRTAKQHFWETISQIVKKINAERVGTGTVVLLLSRIPEIVTEVFFFLLRKEKWYMENTIINYILSAILYVWEILDNTFSLDFGIGNEFIHIDTH